MSIFSRKHRDFKIEIHYFPAGVTEPVITFEIVRARNIVEAVLLAAYQTSYNDKAHDFIPDGSRLNVYLKNNYHGKKAI